MRFVIRPVQAPTQEIDLTHQIIAAIADKLWRLYGGNDQLNWFEAEMHLRRLVESMRSQVRHEVNEAVRVEKSREQMALMAPQMPNGARSEASREHCDPDDLQCREDIRADTVAQTARSADRLQRRGRAKVRVTQPIGAM